MNAHINLPISESSSLEKLLNFLKQTPAMQSKQAIAKGLGEQDRSNIHAIEDLYRLAGDDTAAVKYQDHYLLHACEGMIPSFVENAPYFAGWSAVMANVSDIAAMGGRAVSVVNSFWHTHAELAQQLMAGMQDACNTYGVPLVGGHTHIDESFQPALSVAIQGHAKNLLSVMHLKTDQRIVMALNMKGQFYPNTTYWKCFENVSAKKLRAQLEVLPKLAEDGLAFAARDISNAGILGSLLMLLEASACGANICLNHIPKPENVEWQHWLQIFPSFGFLLTVEEAKVAEVQQRFANEGICCVDIGSTTSDGKVWVIQDEDQQCFWDFNQQLFTGLSYRNEIARIHQQNKAQQTKAQQTEAMH